MLQHAPKSISTQWPDSLSYLSASPRLRCCWSWLRASVQRAEPYQEAAGKEDTGKVPDQEAAGEGSTGNHVQSTHAAGSAMVSREEVVPAASNLDIMTARKHVRRAQPGSRGAVRLLPQPLSDL